ncbi:hypothetical protein [Desulfovibrio sp. SGI.169]|uniref:hypothetical protein n=1 Tax=Desulfovibrio sp. SGI.169 TaxID=3420561 RepID=UPI003D09567E
MSTKEYILISGGIVVALSFVIVWLRALVQRIQSQRHRRNVIRQLLQSVQEQNEIFDLKKSVEGNGKNGLSATLLEQKGASLIMEVLDYVPSEWVGAPVVAHFRDPRPEGPIYYQFHTSVQAVESEHKKSRLSLAAPVDLEVGQKRKFIRVKPHHDAVLGINTWPIDPSKPFPRSMAEAGPPLISYRLGMENAPVQVEDISSTGMALSFQKEYAKKWPVDLIKGSQLLCAIAYLMDPKNEQPGAYWCVCRLLNTREPADRPVLILGLEFTYWAMLEKGKSRLHWFRCSPSAGVTHIAQWVMRMGLEQSKRL